MSRGVWRGSERVLTEIELKRGEPVDKALGWLKKRIDREGTLKVVRNHRHFEKPGEQRRRNEKAAWFSAMLCTFSGFRRLTSTAATITDS